MEHYTVVFISHDLVSPGFRQVGLSAGSRYLAEVMARSLVEGEIVGLFNHDDLGEDMATKKSLAQRYIEELNTFREHTIKKRRVEAGIVFLTFADGSELDFTVPMVQKGSD